LAFAESSDNPLAVSKDGHDKGMFQLRDIYNKARGVIDPFDPVESVGHANTILLASFKVFKAWRPAIAAYRQGDGGVLTNGITYDSSKYVSRILARFSRSKE
jgi:hypothetical protein